MSIRKIKKMTVMLLFSAVFLLVGCNSHEEIAFENPYLEPSPLPEDVLGHLTYGLSGISFGVHAFSEETSAFDEDNLDEYISFNGQIVLENQDDLLEANVENISRSERYFILKAFINYEEVAFRVLGGDSYQTQFIFSIPGGYGITIPFSINTDELETNGTQKLTVATFVEPERHAIEEDGFWPSHSVSAALNLDLSIGNSKEIILATSYNTEPLERREDNGEFPVFEVNQALTDLYSARYIDFANLPTLRVHPGEEVEISFIVTPSPLYVSWQGEGEMPSEWIAENYVIVALLDWQQIALNGEPYLMVDTKNREYESISDFGTFTITVPDEVGLYDFVALLVPNAAHQSTIHLYRPLEISTRFTIEVVNE